MSKVSKGLEKAGVVGASATLLGGAGSALLLALAASPAAASATWTVDTLADGVANASDCTIPVVDSCSLRDALAAAAAGDSITFSAALFTGGAGTITLNSGPLVDIGVDVLGPGANVLTIDGDGASGVFDITPAVTGSTISGVTITGGVVSEGDGGGAIITQGANTLTVRDSVLTGNSGGIAGGAIYAQNLVLTGSTVSNNTSSYFGGGIVVTEHLIVSNSTIANNSATMGGGIALFGGIADLTVTDSTISGNSAGVGGGIGGYTTSGNMLIANSTFTGNASLGKGGAIGLNAPNVEILMSTISGNSSESGDPFYSGGGLFIYLEGSIPTVNLTGTVVSGNTAGVGGTGDLVIGTDPLEAVTATVTNAFIGSSVSPNITFIGTGLLRGDSPMLGVLANNGGTTMTMLPLTGSPLIDAGPATIPVFVGNQFDQRGPGFPRVVGTMSDIGAVEIQALDPDPVVPAFTG